MQRPVLDGGFQGDTVRVTATDVVIEGLQVRNSGADLGGTKLRHLYPARAPTAPVVRDCGLSYNLFGLWIEKAQDVRIERNTITGKRDLNSSQRGNGIQLYNTTGARIIGNNIGFRA